MLKQMKHIGTIFLLFFLILFGAGVSFAEKPNIIIVLVDDLGWTDLASYGSELFETPNLDRLAGEGVRFTNAYAPCAVCSPSRASLQTGLNPARTGVTDWIRSKFQGGIVPPDGRNPEKYIGNEKTPLLCPPNKLFLENEFLTIAEHLKSHGYVTGHIGKWHLGQENHTPEKQGYDINIAGCDLGQPPGYFDPYESGNPQYAIPEQVFKRRQKGEYLTDREADEAVGFIRNNKDKPFFLHLAHYAVHVPLQGKENLVTKYREKLEKMRKEGKEPKQTNAVYAAMVESVDDAIGKIVATLEEEGLSKKTYVIFTSDNGGLLGPTDITPLRSGKGYPYEGGIRVPFIVWGAERIETGKTCNVPVILYDIFPSVCDWANIPLPEDVPFDGLSINPLIDPEKNADIENLAERPLFWHFPHYRFPNNPGELQPYSIVRLGSWKLIRYFGDKEPELFDLSNDPGEKRNLAKENSEKATKLEKLLNEYYETTGAKLPRANPAYNP